MEPILYGELTIIGFNGCTDSAHQDPRRQSKIALYKRPVANGVCPGSMKHLIGSHDSLDSKGRGTHSVSYTLSRHETVVVEYVADRKTDMFQIGRSTNNHIDFVVSEPNPVRSRSRHHLPPHRSKSPSSTSPAGNAGNGPANVQSNNANFTHPESAVSRFACRIHVQRDPPHTARIYAAGFDTSNKIVLGELAVKWKSDGQMDGLTTNGVMILRADDEDVLSNGNITAGNNVKFQSRWREVSICGSVYQMREKRCIPNRENRVNEDNILWDKTLIDLCGVTLFWRSAAGLKSTLDSAQLTRMIDCLNDARFQCPVMYHTLRLSYPEPPTARTKPAGTNTHCRTTDSKLTTVETLSEPYVYLNCGHVHGWHTWLAEGDQFSSSGGAIVRTCALCLQPSRFVPLRMGLESAFYVDRALATHCFNPCGHMASERTVRYWSSIPLPNTHNFEFLARCPFCLVPVESKPVLLRFSGDVDADSLAHSLQVTLELDAGPSGSSKEHVVSAN